jgi:uncharacterized protein (DUF58 family)
MATTEPARGRWLGRLVAVVGLGLLLASTYLTAVRPAYALSYALGLLLVMAWAWVQMASRGIVVTRVLDSGRLEVGEAFEEEIAVKRKGLGMAPWVEITELGDGDAQLGRVIGLGQEAVRWKARGTYWRRGWMTFGPTLVRVREPFGLFWKEKKMGQPTRVLVHPRVRPISDFVSVSARTGGEAQGSGAWAEYPPETGGVRDYTTGDAFGRIHWGLSGHHGRLMSKTFEPPVSTDLWIILDLDQSVHVGEGLDSTLEEAVSLAASLAWVVHTRGRQAGLAANDAKGTVLEPHRAARQDRRVMDYLAVAQADGRRSLHEMLERSRVEDLTRRALAVITPSADGRWLERLQRVRGRQATIAVFYVDAHSFGGPEQEMDFKLGPEVDFHVVRKGGG